MKLIDYDKFRGRLINRIKELDTDPIYTEEERHTVKEVYESVLYKMSEEEILIWKGER